MVLPKVLPKTVTVSVINGASNITGRDMANSGFSVFTNNNYINVLDENCSIPLTPPSLSSSITSTFPCLNSSPVNKFTFATPTQTNLVSHVALCTSSPSGSVANIIARTMPGVGATWQHSVPNVAQPRLQMDVTWQNCVPQMSPSQFGVEQDMSPQLSVPQEMPWMQDSRSNDVPVFSAVPKLRPQICQKRGPKRHFGLHDVDIGCSPSKQFISEEMMASRMRSLSIDSSTETSFSASPPPAVKTHPHPSSTLIRDCHHTHQPRPASNWERMKQIEERLEDEDEDEIASTVNKNDSEPRLHLLSQDFSARDLLSSNPLLPKKIIDDLIKPSMQIVLWKPPGDIIKNTIADVVSTADTKRNLVSDSESASSLVPESESISSMVPESESISSMVPETESQYNIVPDPTENSTLPVLPILQQSLSPAAGSLNKNNSSVLIEEDMDL